MCLCLTSARRKLSSPSLSSQWVLSSLSKCSHVLEMKGWCTLHCKRWALGAVPSQMKHTNGKTMCLGGQDGKSLTHIPNWSALGPYTLCALVPTTSTQITSCVLWCWLLWCSPTACQSSGHPSEDGYRQDLQGWEVSGLDIFCPKLCSRTKKDSSLALSSLARALWAALGCTMGSCSAAYPVAVATSWFPLSFYTALWYCMAHKALLVIVDLWLTLFCTAM